MMLKVTSKAAVSPTVVVGLPEVQMVFYKSCLLEHHFLLPWLLPPGEDSLVNFILHFSDELEGTQCITSFCPVTPKPHETFPPSNMPLGATEAPILRPAPLRKL